MAWLIVAAAALALFAGLCASAEVALMRVSRSGAGDLGRSRKGASPRAVTRLQAVLADPSRYLAVLLLARISGETAAVVFMAAPLVHWLGSGWQSFLLTAAIMIVVLYLLAGVGPRILGRQHERLHRAGLGGRALPGGPAAGAGARGCCSRWATCCRRAGGPGKPSAPRRNCAAWWTCWNSARSSSLASGP